MRDRVLMAILETHMIPGGREVQLDALNGQVREAVTTYHDHLRLFLPVDYTDLVVHRWGYNHQLPETDVLVRTYAPLNDGR